MGIAGKQALRRALMEGQEVPRGALAGVGGGGVKRKESLQLRPWNLNICREKVDAKC